jgi:hypothetical protein
MRGLRPSWQRRSEELKDIRGPADAYHLIENPWFGRDYK